MRTALIGSALGSCCACAIALLATACALPSRNIPAAGSVFGQSVETTVDSELAAYYLEHFDDWRALDSEHARRLAQLPACSADSLDRDALRRLADRTSVDVAGLYAAECLMRENRGLGAEFQRLLARIRALAEPAAAKPAGLLDEMRDFAVVIVPGWDYVDSGAITGADFARQLRQFGELGIASYRVPIDENGSVEESAAIIRSEIARIGRIHAQLLLVSASSGGPAAALALGEPAAHAEVANVRAWLNLGGILGGMPLIDRYSTGLGYVALRLFSFLNGWDFDDVRSMSAARSRERLARLELPEGLLVVNYIGIPFSGDISERAAFFHARLRSDGPNDGLTLVTDAVMPGTRTLVALGQDHFFADDPELEARTLALASLVARTVDSEHAEPEVAEPIGVPCPQIASVDARGDGGHSSRR